MVDPVSPGNRVGPSSLYTDAAPAETIPYTGKIKRHFQTFVEQKRQEKLNYVLVRIRGRLQSRLKPVTKVLKRITIKYCLKIGQTLPRCVRSQYILNMYYEAIEKYHPNLYPGSAIYIRSERQGSTRYVSEWSRLIRGGLEVHGMSGDHIELLKDGNIRIWAETLRNALEKTRRRDLALSSRNQNLEYVT
jgi:thioesterase domain-containing protein